MDVDWTHGAAHMWNYYGVSVEQASEVIADVDALLYDPDPKSNRPKAHVCLVIPRAVSVFWS